jgi:hypothetical protein
MERGGVLPMLIEDRTVVTADTKQSKLRRHRSQGRRCCKERHRSDRAKSSTSTIGKPHREAQSGASLSSHAAVRRITRWRLRFCFAARLERTRNWRAGAFQTSDFRSFLLV